MATVYLARDLRHERSVALKVLDREIGALLGPERFLREIKTAARLHHPHIVQLHDSGEAAGLLYYVMPYVEGESLRQRLIRQPRLPIEEALRITREIGDALDYAHRHGLVHRDVKPENILIADGHALLADFGIAKAMEDTAGPGLTQTGLLVGTPAYMSPEQVLGATDLDARADVYSLGCVLYEMLAGEPPFSGTTPQAVVAKRLSGPAPHLRALVDVPVVLDDAVTKALAPAAADRFPTAADFTQALTAIPLLPGSRPGPVRATVRRRRFPVAIATLVLGVLIGLGVLFAWRRTQAGDQSGSKATARRLAVLPFKNLGDSADAYFADGMADEVRGKLASVSGLEVIARASSERYQQTTKSPQEIGRELSVGYLLTGTVRWAKLPDGTSRVRVSPELVLTASGATTWQEPFEAALTDVFQVQADIAGRVARSLDLALADSAQQLLAKPPTSNVTAYPLYLLGRYHWNFRTKEGLLKAVSYFQQAIERDSGYALAYAGLADAYLNLSDYQFMPGTKATPLAEAAAQRALLLNPMLAEPHASLGGVHEARWEWRAAEAEYRRAIALNPAYPTARHWLALHMTKFRGGSDEALREIRRALDLDPLSLPINADLAEILYVAGDYDAAFAQSRKTLELQPDFPWALEILGLAAAARGRHEEAISSLQSALRTVPGNPQLLADLAYVYGVAGHKEKARALIAQLKAPENGAPAPEHIGMAYAGLGEADSALRWLQLTDRNARSSVFQLNDPRLGSLPSDPRYAALLKGMGLE